jgi:hypothetical protein
MMGGRSGVGGNQVNKGGMMFSIIAKTVLFNLDEVFSIPKKLI